MPKLDGMNVLFPPARRGSRRAEARSIQQPKSCLVTVFRKSRLGNGLLSSTNCQIACRREIHCISTQKKKKSKMLNWKCEVHVTQHYLRRY